MCNLSQLFFISIVAICQFLGSALPYEIETQNQGTSEEICNNEVKDLSCPENHVILITETLFGHIEQGRCINVDLGFFGCQTDVTSIADTYCSGRQTCQLRIYDAIAAHNPCNSALNVYMHVTYSCQHVFTPDIKPCDRLPYYNVTASSGYLASSVTMATGCGTMAAPWILNSQPGQTINITLFDFGVEETAEESRGYMVSVATGCKPYGQMQDDVLKNPTMICGGQQRQATVMTSSKQQVNVSFTAAMNGQHYYFLLYFQVSGCPDEPTTPTTWFKRTSDSLATMGCEHARVSWTLKCQGTKWVGHGQNCSNFLPPETHTDDDSNDDIPVGLAIAIIIGAALVVCSCIVIVGIIRYRRRDNYDYSATYNTQTMLLRPHHHHHQQTEQYELRCTCPVPPPQNKVPSHRAPEVQVREEQPRTMTIRRSPHFHRHYSLKKTVEAEGNDYEHIWQSALPKPAQSPQTIAKEVQNNNNNTMTHNATKDSNNVRDTSASSSRTSSFKDNNLSDNTVIKSKPYYVTSKDILSSGAKESYDGLDTQKAVLQTFMDTKTSADVADL